MGISVIQAETDTIVFDILRESADWSAFARELYDVCPDIVDQGVGAVKELDEEIRCMRQVLLWWDSGAGPIGHGQSGQCDCKHVLALRSLCRRAASVS